MGKSIPNTPASMIDYISRHSISLLSLIEGTTPHTHFGRQWLKQSSGGLAPDSSMRGRNSPIRCNQIAVHNKGAKFLSFPMNASAHVEHFYWFIDFWSLEFGFYSSILWSESLWVMVHQGISRIRTSNLKTLPVTGSLYQLKVAVGWLILSFWYHNINPWLPPYCHCFIVHEWHANLF